MIAKMKRKSVIIGIVSFVVVALVAAFAVPALAASPPWGSRPGANQNVTVVQGILNAGGIDTINSRITINTAGTPSSVVLDLTSNTNFNIHGAGWLNPSSLSGNVTAAYKTNQTVPPGSYPVASQVTINMPGPAPRTGSPQGITPGTGNPPANNNFGRVQGTLSPGSTAGTIDVTFTEPSNITLGLPANQAVTILYNSSTSAIQSLMSGGPGGNFGGRPGGFFNTPGGNQPAPRFGRNGTT